MTSPGPPSADGDDRSPDPRGQDASRPTSLPPDPVSFNKPAARPPLDFDPYRFGKPDRPIPPEYAPPGYVPPPEYGGPPAYGAQGQAAQGQAAQGYGTQGYGAQSYGPAGYGPPPDPNLPRVPLPPPHFGQYPQPRTGNGKAIAGLAFGIASIVFCWLSVLDALLVIPGIVFSTLSLRGGESRAAREGRGMAIAGLVCSIIGAVLAIALTAWIYSRFGECTEFDNGSAAFRTCIRDHL